jgi:HopA1 effector protein family
MTGYRDQLAQALRAVAVTSPTSYSWFGRRSRPLPEAVRAALGADTAREYLIGLLEHELYRSFYTQGRPVPESMIDSTRADLEFVDALSRANTGVGGWEPGWRVEALEHRFLVVTRNGLRVRVHAADCGPPGAGHEPGAAVTVRRPKELRAASPGFYTALGDTEITARREYSEVRVYFNVRAEGAAALVAACTRLLNQAKVPFDLKVIDRPAGFLRCDAAVLYLTDDAFERARESLRTITSACANHLVGDPPAFTKPLRRGVAVGEHRPHLGASFGSTRCRLVAEGIVAAYETGVRRLSDRVDAVARCFALKELDIDFPYLEPGSTDRYDI